MVGIGILVYDGPQRGRRFETERQKQIVLHDLIGFLNIDAARTIIQPLY